MNYKSQLKGWAVDRVIEMWKAVPPSAAFISKGNPDAAKDYLPNREDCLQVLKTQADDLAAYAYVPREDLESTAKDLFELVRNAEAGKASINAMIGTLEHIKQDRISQGIDKIDAQTPTGGQA